MYFLLNTRYKDKYNTFKIKPSSRLFAAMYHIALIQDDKHEIIDIFKLINMMSLHNYPMTNPTYLTNLSVSPFAQILLRSGGS